MSHKAVVFVAAFLPLALAVAVAQQHGPPSPADQPGQASAAHAAQRQEPSQQDIQHHVHQMQSITRAVAVVYPTEGNHVLGVVWFVQEPDDTVRVQADFENLPPGTAHGFHIHEFGDATSRDGSSAGSHYNPADRPHGLPDHSQRHAGDLGNIRSDAQGRAHYQVTLTDITIAGLRNPILGRAVVVHEKPDDGSQPVGNAGPRLAVGVIGVANPATPMPPAAGTPEGEPAAAVSPPPPQ